MTGELQEKQELKGLGGWLVLFQIYIIMAVAASVQTLVLALITGNTFFYVFSQAFRIYYIAFMAVSFIISLLCMIFFYRKKIAFRILFIVYSLLAVSFSLVYYLSGEVLRYIEDTSVYMAYFADFIKVLTISSIIIGIGIYAAFIIALYKSKRVKNTFS